MATNGTRNQAGADGRLLVAAVAVALVGLVGYFTLGMPGMDHGSKSMPSMDATHVSEMALSPAQFADRVSTADAFVVNVHTGDETRIPGTDAAMPYDQITSDPRLPADRATAILLYCKTGQMSADAAAALMAAGYTDVMYLRGGMDAWDAAGRTTTSRPYYTVS